MNLYFWKTHQTIVNRIPTKTFSVQKVENAETKLIVRKSAVVEDGKLIENSKKSRVIANLYGAVKLNVKPASEQLIVISVDKNIYLLPNLITLEARTIVLCPKIYIIAFSFFCFKLLMINFFCTYLVSFFY